MPHLKILIPSIVGDRICQVGDEIPDASDALAEALIADETAQLVEPAKPASKRAAKSEGAGA